MWANLTPFSLQGPAFLQCLALLKGFDLDEMEPGSPEFIHTVAEPPSRFRPP